MHAPDDRICVSVDDALSSADCRDIIAAAEGRGFADARPAYPPRYRNNDRQILDDPTLAAKLLAALRPHLPKTLDGGTLVGLNERFRICRYRDGQQFTVHQDGAWHPEPQVASRLTLMLYLNDDHDFSGGMTRFYTRRGGPCWRQVSPKAGRLMLFDHLLWHDGQTVHSGEKYILRTDVLYRHPPTSGHRGYVWDVVALPDGRIASGGRDKTIQTWKDGQSLSTTEAHTLSVLALAVDTQGSLWSGSRDRHVSNQDSGESFAAHDGAVLCLSPWGRGVASGGADGVVREWPSGAVLARHGGWVRALTVAQGHLISGGEDGTVCVDGVPAWRPGAEVWSLCVLGGEVFAGLADGRVVALRAGEVARRHAAGVRALCVHRGQLASGGEDAVVQWAGRSRAVGGFVSGLASTGGALWCAGYAGLERLFAGGEEGDAAEVLAEPDGAVQ